MRLGRNGRRGAGAALLVAVAVVAAGCGGGGDAARVTGDGTASAAAGSGTTYTVGVDGSIDGATASFHEFFPDRLAVHPGDSVVFRRPDNGEPHTVTFATEPPTRQRVPGKDFFEGGFGGPPRKDASTPCFLSSGAPPSDGCSEAQQQPVPFDGTQSWFSSGGMLGDEEFTVELAKDIAPGEYLFICLLHTPRMKATVQVVEPEQPADDPTEVAARGAARLERLGGEVLEMVDDPPRAVEGQVLAATADRTFTAWSNAFTPDEIEIPAGGTVTWSILGFHTISFNAPESARPLYERADDGSVQENELAARPRGDPTAWDGSGMLSSGLRDGVFPPARFSATFTVPGTYAYICLVHFDMEGKVKVLA